MSPTLLRNCANTSLNWQLCRLAPIFMPQLVHGWTRVVRECLNDNVWWWWQLYPTLEVWSIFCRSISNYWFCDFLQLRVVVSECRVSQVALTGSNVQLCLWDTLHFITIHYIRLYHITLHYTQVALTVSNVQLCLSQQLLHYITSHYITLHYIISHYITLHTHVALTVSNVQLCLPQYPLLAYIAHIWTLGQYRKVK